MSIAEMGPDPIEALKLDRLRLQQELGAASVELNRAYVWYHGLISRIIEADAQLAAQGIDKSFLYVPSMPDDLAGTSPLRLVES